MPFLNSWKCRCSRFFLVAVSLLRSSVGFFAIVSLLLPLQFFCYRGSGAKFLPWMESGFFAQINVFLVCYVGKLSATTVLLFSGCCLILCLLQLSLLCCGMCITRFAILLYPFHPPWSHEW